MVDADGVDVCSAWAWVATVPVFRLPWFACRSSTTFWWRRARSSGSVAAAVGKGVQATTKDAAVTASNKRLVVIGMHPTDRHQST